MDSLPLPLPLLPLDVLLHVFRLLPLSSVLALRRTSRSLAAVSRLRAVWALLFRAHVLDEHLPCPDLPRPLPDLDAADLEALTRRARLLRRTWSSAVPVPRRRVTWAAPAEERVIFLRFLPARSNRWLVSVRMSARPTSYLLQCWDLVPDHPRCVAELRHADGPYGGVVLNSDPASPAVLAMQTAQTETFSIDFEAHDPECGFETHATIDGVRQLHLLAGSTLVTRRTDDGGPLCLWDLADLKREKVLLLNPSLVQPDDRVHAVHLAHDYALVVRAQTIEIYTTAPPPSLLPVRGAPIAYPLVQFRFQWRTDAVVLCEQHAASPGPQPIHLLVRFGSIYPWPVNVLHHYLLVPNPCWARRSTRGSPRAPRPVTSEYNLPYDPRPQAMHTIGSPVRLFGHSAMALGRYGTALWLDHHTEEWLGPSERGQRLAGRMVWCPPGRVTGRKVGGTSRIPMATDVGACGGRLAAFEYPADAEATGGADSSNASMVFDTCDDDAWTRIAMSEEAGRIVIGHVDGAITLLEY